MKKHSIALACLCTGLFLSSTAHSQAFLYKELAKWPEFNPTGGSRLTVYGTVDAGINVTKAGSADSVKKEQSGGEYTSKLGFYGREDLGDGLLAEFSLEHGLQADTGAASSSSQFWDRASWVGLKSKDWGTVRLGNQLGVTLPLFVDPFGVVSTNSMSYWLASAIVQKSAYTTGLSASSPIGLNSDLGAGATQVTTRVPRSITYATPRIAGFDAKFIYAPGANTASYNKKYNQGAAFSYANGPWFASASYNQVFGVNASTLQAVRTDVTGIAGIFDTGSIVLSAAVNQSAVKTDTGGTATVYSLGFILPREQHIVRLSAVYRDTSGVRNTSTQQEVSSSALGLMAGYDYQLSKKAGLYARYGVLRNFGASTILLNNAALPVISGTSNAQLGIESKTASVGMYLHF